MPQDVVGTRRLFHPPRIDGVESTGTFNGFEHAPFLIGVKHQPVVRTNLLAHDPRPAKDIRRHTANLEFEVGPDCGETFAAQSPYLFVTKTNPASRSRVRRISLRLQEF